VAKFLEKDLWIFLEDSNRDFQRGGEGEDTDVCPNRKIGEFR
jgi:hypothetical protein